MRRLLGSLVVAAALIQAPALADPAVSASMPAIRASVNDNQIIVRMEPGVLGSVRSLEPRTLVVVARDANGGVLEETANTVSRRMTYARVAMTTAMKSASTVSVSLR